MSDAQLNPQQVVHGLADRLLEAIGDVERLALAIDPERRAWSVNHVSVTVASNPDDYVACGPWDYTPVDPDDAAHIVAHDPSVELRRCAADRRAVERFVHSETELHPDAFRVMEETLHDLAKVYGVQVSE